MESETDECQGCGELLEVENLLVTECDSILCHACLMHHNCDECFPSEADSDSDYDPTTTSCCEDELEISEIETSDEE